MTAGTGLGQATLRKWALLAGLLALTLGVGALGSLATAPQIPGWYAGLEKPGFTPPSWVFGPVWTTLYVIMAVAAWRVAMASGDGKARCRALILFALQLALNALWPHVFFGLPSPRAGLVVILALGVALAATMAAFWRVDRVSALMLVPYAAWTAYATALNAGIVVLN